MATTFTRRCIPDWGVTGATLFACVYNGSNTAVVARTSTGVAEHPTGSGIYYKDVTWANSWTSPRVVWDDGTNYAVEDMGIADTTQISGTATALGALSGSQSITISGTGI